MASTDALLESIAAFRKVGFFESERGSDRDVLAAIERGLADAYSRTLEDVVATASSPVEIDGWLLVTDRARAWYGDLEGALPGDDAYEAVVRGWAAITRGALAIGTVEETGRDDGDGIAEVRIVANGQTVRFEPEPGDMIDTRLLAELNRVMRGADRFTISDPLGDNRFVLALDAATRKFFETKRGWTFYL